MLIHETMSTKPPATLSVCFENSFSSFLFSDCLTCSGSRLLFLFKDRNSLGLQTRASAENTRIISYNALRRIEIVKQQKHYHKNNNKPELTHQIIIGFGSQTCCTYSLIAEDAEQGCVVRLKVLP